MVLSDLLLKIYSKKLETNVLFSKEVFSLLIIKLSDQKTKNLLLNLLVKSINIYETRDNIESINFLSKLNILYQTGNNIFLKEIFRTALLNSFSKTDFNFFLQEFKQENCSGNFFNEKFESILKSLSEYCIGLPADLLYLFMEAKLVNKEKDITHKGFEFLLKMKGEQIGILIFEILNYLRRKYEYEEIILVFAELLLKKQNISYVQEEYGELFHYFHLIGLVEYRDDNILLVTPLIDLLTDLSLSERDRSIVVETNYKIYANIHRSYEISILKLFSSVDIEFPELLIINITRKSVTSAFNKGITAEQINSFLKNKARTINPVIFKQIKIWENMRNRISVKDVIYYKDFRSAEEYHTIFSFIKENNYLVYNDEMTRVIIADLKCHEEIKRVLKK